MPQPIVIVIGAGAAGYFAAIHAAASGAMVYLLEKSPKVLSKVRVSGGGRCNLTHDAPQISQLLEGYPRGDSFLKKIFGRFAVKDTLKWFESRGLVTKVEADGRMFPHSDKAEDVAQTLIREANRLGVKLIVKEQVYFIEKEGLKVIVKSNKNTYKADAVVLCTGGYARESSYDWVLKSGLSVRKPVPSLFTFNSPGDPICQLKGISMPDALVKMQGFKTAYRGPVLITHWGLSGPAVLKLSAFGAEWLYERAYQAKVHIRWLAAYTEESLRDELIRYKVKYPKRQPLNYALFGIPQRLWQHLLQKAGFEEQKTWQEVSKKQINRLVQHLFGYELDIRGKTTFKEEFVTAGGIELSQVDAKTMESKEFPGLFLAGEVLDIDGITGGYNFQAAWSTGYLAGVSAAQYAISQCL